MAARGTLILSLDVHNSERMHPRVVWRCVEPQLQQIVPRFERADPPTVQGASCLHWCGQSFEHGRGRLCLFERVEFSSKGSKTTNQLEKFFPPDVQSKTQQCLHEYRQFPGGDL